MSNRFKNAVKESFIEPQDNNINILFIPFFGWLVFLSIIGSIVSYIFPGEYVLIKIWSAIIISIILTVKPMLRICLINKECKRNVDDEQMFEKRLNMMKKRQAYFSAVAEEYSTFDSFIQSSDDWLSIMGIELRVNEKCIDLHIQLDCKEYEDYFIILAEDGMLTVSDIVGWQDEYCCNRLLNIENGKEALEEDVYIKY